MGNRNACIGRYLNGRTQRRHNLIWDASLRQGQGLFSSTSEDERIASLQPHYGITLLCIVNEQSVNPLLFHTVATRSFADIDAFSMWTHFLKQLGTGQAIIDHDIGGTQAAQPLDG